MLYVGYRLEVDYRSLRHSTCTMKDLFRKHHGCGLDSFITPVIAFHVALTVSIDTARGPVSPVPFNNVMVNEGAGWNPNSYKFSPPVSGIYYFSLSVATASGKAASMYLMKNTQLSIMSNVWETGKHNGLETSRAAALMQVVTTDFIYCKLPTASQYFEGNSNNQNYLLGFLTGTTLPSKIAWSVGRSLGPFTGPVDYLPYNEVNVNEGGVWNAATNSAKIFVAGLYITDLTTYLCGSTYPYGVGNGNENLQLLLNGSPIIELKLMPFTASDSITRSRAIAVKLAAGDELRVRVATSGSYYHSSGILGVQFHIFSGLFINPLN